MAISWVHRLSNMLFWWGDKLIIGTVFGFSTLGSYQLAVQYLLLLDTIPRALTIYLIPQESQGKQNKKIKIFAIGISVIVVIVSIVILPFAIDTFFSEYQESILPAQIMSIATIPIMFYNIFEAQFFGKEQPRVVGNWGRSSNGLIFCVNNYSRKYIWHSWNSCRIFGIYHY